jgi:hypothetical protein
MILSVHLADIGKRAALSLMRRSVEPAQVSGMIYAATTIGVVLGGRLIPTPKPGRVGLITAFEDDRHLDDFLANHPVAKRLSGGWHVRLDPLRVSGVWSDLPDLSRREVAIDPQEPVAVLTLGRLQASRVLPFRRVSAAAEVRALAAPGLLAATGLARPPHLVATFSLWQTAAQMREYAYGRNAPEHMNAVRADKGRPFHHESAFLRFRPYAAHGDWDGRNPLALIGGS